MNNELIMPLKKDGYIKKDANKIQLIKIVPEILKFLTKSNEDVFSSK